MCTARAPRGMDRRAETRSGTVANASQPVLPVCGRGLRATELQPARHTRGWAHQTRVDLARRGHWANQISVDMRRYMYVDIRQ